MNERIRRVLKASGQLSADVATLADDADLFRVGLKSISAVMLMVSLEDEFKISFPESMLHRNLFTSIANIETAIVELTARQSPQARAERSL